MMFKAQFRIVGGIDKLSLNKMCVYAVAPKSDPMWENWNIGEFTSLEHAIKEIEEAFSDGPVVKQRWNVDIYWFEIASHYFQIRFFQYPDSPWKIGLNDNV